MKTGTARLQLTCAIAGLSVLRVAAGMYAATLTPALPIFYDSHDYRELAVSVASGRGFTNTRPHWFEAPRPAGPMPEAFRPPLLAFLAGWLLDVKPDSFASLLALQGVLAALLAGVVSFLLLDVAGPRAAWTGLLLCTAHPLFLHYSLHFSTEILFSLCLACFLWFWLWETSNWRWPAVGFAIGIATLARATALVLVPLSLAVVLGVGPRGRRMVAAALLTGSFLLTVTPWAIRNHAVFGEPRLTSWYGGYIFWFGNNRLNLEAYRAGTDAQFLEYQKQAYVESVRLANSMQDPRYRHPREQEKFWFRHAWDDIHSYGIMAWAGLLASKAWHFWRPWPLAGAHQADRFWLVAAVETVLLATGAGGLIVLWKSRSAVLLPLALLLTAGTLAHALSFAYLRYRVPFVDLVMVVGTSVLAGSVWPGPTRPPASAAPGPGRD